MNTVKCPKCEAMQEIYVNSDKKAVCVFCGEEITNLPENFNPEDYMTERTQDGEQSAPPVVTHKGEEITAEYTLSYEDVRSGLYETGRVSRKKTKTVVETVIIALFFGIQIYNIIDQGIKSITPSQIFMMVVMAALIPFVWLVPVIYEKKYINSIADGTVLTARLYEDVLFIEVEGAESPTEVKLDKTSVFFDSEKRFFLVIPNGSVIILPKKYFAEDQLFKVEQRLKEGTLDKFPEETKK